MQIGKIKDILRTPKTTSVVVTWYYAPEEVVGGRKPFHGSQELLHSDHEDTISVKSLMERINVHTLEEYQKLDEILEHDYFSRFFYKAVTREFVPDQVPVVCHCEQPYNPDIECVQCDGCTEWYHTECLTPKARADIVAHPGKPYLCDSCIANGTTL
ncbi:MAG: hypothetical protein WDW38_010518 [Sanguina aurantia]